MTYAIEKGREHIAKRAEADGETIFAREVRAGCWDHREDVGGAIKAFGAGAQPPALR